jgi:hypothetical protein
VAERFLDASVQSSVALDLKLIDAYDELLRQVELEIVRHAKQHDAQAFHLLDSVPGIGKILALVILYEANGAPETTPRFGVLAPGLALGSLPQRCPVFPSGPMGSIVPRQENGEPM